MLEVLNTVLGIVVLIALIAALVGLVFLFLPARRRLGGIMLVGGLVVWLAGALVSNKLDTMIYGWSSSSHVVCARQSGFDEEQREATLKAFGGPDQFDRAVRDDICDTAEWDRFLAADIDSVEVWKDASELERQLALPPGDLPGPMARANNRAPFVTQENVEVEGSDTILEERLLGFRRFDGDIVRYMRVVHKEGSMDYEVKEFSELQDEAIQSICEVTRRADQIMNDSTGFFWRFYDQNDNLVRTWDLREECV